jgi:RNA-directed DNA polymerase
LGVPTVRDRIVQSALRHVIEPIFEREFAPQSYGFRPGRGCKDALRRVQQLLEEGRVWVVDADLKSYFDTIPHGPLLARVREKIADGRVIELIEGYLKAGVMESVKGWQPSEGGTPQGAVISPLLANIYLNPLDWEMVQAGVEMVRYADDFVVLCHREEEAHRALEKIQRFVQAQGLTLHPQKTPDHGRQPTWRRLQLPGLSLRAGPEMASSQE